MTDPNVKRGILYRVDNIWIVVSHYIPYKVLSYERERLNLSRKIHNKKIVKFKSVLVQGIDRLQYQAVLDNSLEFVD